MPPTQIGRALRELGIAWIAAHSAPAKGRVERNFGTAQDRLVKGMRVAGVTTIEQANQYLINDYLVWWERELTAEAANPDDAHRRLEKSHHLAASLSHVETRQVRNDYTLPERRRQRTGDDDSSVARLFRQTATAARQAGQVSPPASVAGWETGCAGSQRRTEPGHPGLRVRVAWRHACVDYL